MVLAKASIFASLLLLGQASAKGTLPPIVMKGTKFFYQNGTQFFIKGVAYQQDSAAAGEATSSSKYTDPLADAAACKRDVPLLAALGTNTIRTYAIDPTQNHDDCMALLDAAGIYVISDLSEPTTSINRDTPAWNLDLYKRYTDVIDNLAVYDNVIGFFAGNEVTNNATNTPASAYVKAAVRDTKAYIATKSRWLGVGYAANDDAAIREEIAHYFNCGNQSQAIDFWGYNIYEWCGSNTFVGSGYAEQVSFFSNYSVPVFFAEYGCNNPGGAAGRIWQETTALYSKDMTDVISGGIVYMYFQEANDYGLVSVSGGKASTLKDYDTLKTRIASVKPSSTSMDAYTPTNSPAACPDVSKNWAVLGEELPPTPDSTLCECMYNSLTCVPADSVPDKQFGALFNVACGKEGVCAGISANTTTGVYGAFSMCSAKQQLAYAMDTYYKSLDEAADACNFGGKGVINKDTQVASSCSSGLASASAVNSVAATATAGTSSSGGAATSSKSFASPLQMQNLLTMGDMAVGLYVAVAMGVGAGMVLL
ncbi:putative beta (1-3) glucanosyltransferase gel3p [Cercophora scortea]|uniref:1,3-beta-glucanosyltransferase n=1 Tax=Cercophora scortea TaxID=314031 RepID=A0AAE0IP41_9PEZI|nr:putative beta (1-3) glucanosyltransferase gel3p [Cercophora scortea]